jgi:hypothetical protein
MAWSSQLANSCSATKPRMISVFSISEWIMLEKTSSCNNVQRVPIVLDNGLSHQTNQDGDDGNAYHLIVWDMKQRLVAIMT